MTEQDIARRLQEARLFKNLTLEELSEQTKIPQHYLAALEHGQFKYLPADRISFFLDTVCQQLGIASLVYQPRLEKEITNIRPRTERLNAQKEKRSYLPIIYLSLLSLSILLFIGYTIHKHYEQLREFRATSTTVTSISRIENEASSSSQSDDKTVPSTEASSELAPTLTASAEGNQLSVSLSHPSETVTITLTFSPTEGVSASWIGLTNTKQAQEGITLTAENPTLETTVVDDKEPVVMTIGMTRGLDIMIDQQKLDLSQLETRDVSVITLTIQR